MKKVWELRSYTFPPHHTPVRTLMGICSCFGFL